MHRNIKNIIFDLGDVIIDLFPSDLLRAHYFPKYFDQIKFEEKRKEGVFKSFELGNMDRPSFVNHLRDCSKSHLTDDEIIDLWNAILLSIPKDRIELILELSRTYRIFLLSNTNEIHLEKILSDLAKEGRLTDFESCFEKMYYSHLIHMRKPNEDIYNYVLSDSNLKPAETLFLDDKQQNLDAANVMGIKTQLISRDFDVHKALMNFRDKNNC